jgi:S1-C subfamily serine protease
LPADLTKVAEAHSKARTRPGDDTSYGLQFSPAHSGSQTEPVRDKINTGAAVTAVVPESPAGRAGVRVGDLITAVDAKPVADSAACLEVLAAHRGPTGPVLLINRNGQKTHALLDSGGADKPGPSGSSTPSPTNEKP